MQKLRILFLILISNTSNAFDVNSFILLSKQQALVNHSEVLSNNIANTETTGFKEGRMLERGYKSIIPNAQNNLYDNDISTIFNMSNGALVETGNVFDFAIEGKGFFCIRYNGQVRYSRAGNFVIDSLGGLKTTDGYEVLDDGFGAITIPNTAKELVVKNDGSIFADGGRLGKLAIVNFNNIYEIKPLGNSLFRHINDEQGVVAQEKDYKILQGFREKSNVNNVQQLTTLMEVQRDNATVAKMLGTYDELSKNVISKLGKY